MARYSYTEREIPGGSMVPRFNPKIGETGLNTKLGPRLPNIHQTEGKAFKPGVRDSARRSRIGLPARFDKS